MDRAINIATAGRRTRGRWPATAAAVVLAAALGGCESDEPSGPGTGNDSRAMSGGETTIFNATSQAFMLPAPNLGDVELHIEGDRAFDAVFVSAPAAVHGGLGPAFNSTSCAGCHVSNGRGRPPLPGEIAESLLLRLSVAGVNPDGTGAPLPAPGFGGQLATQAVFGVTPEAGVAIVIDEQTFHFADGQTYALARPTYELTAPYLPLPPGLLVSPRVAPPVFGRGLLEAVPESAILARSDPGDRDGDGVSGRPNWVFDEATRTLQLGRFGWKAGQPTLLQQAAAAYRNDMGVTNPTFPGESGTGQPQDDGLADDPEIDQATLDAAVFYTQTLAVPARRFLDEPQVRRGERLFDEAGCVACHVPRMRTGSFAGISAISNQDIRPYTDLLLHDMGEDLADGRPDFAADGREWRTAPLWGLGLTEVVNGHTRLLHDGRARSILEAVMWHGGEAEAAREFVRRLPADQRRELLAFLESL